MPKPRKKQPGDNKDFVRVNEMIRIPKILVIDHNNQNLGEMSNRDALRLAQQVDLDLVEVSPNVRPPVCRIMDYGKFQYEKQKKAQKKQPASKEKEISFRYVIDDHDMNVKANQARRFLEKGHRVKLTVIFKKREKAHKKEGFVIMEKMISLLEDIAQYDKAPAFEGGNVVVRLEKVKNSKDGQNTHQKPARESA